MTIPKPETPYLSVEIYDQTYHLSGPDIEQVQNLAARVDACMREVAARAAVLPIPCPAGGSPGCAQPGR